MIKIHYKNSEKSAETVRKTLTFCCEAPFRNAMKKLVDKFELLGQISDVKNKTRARRSRRAANIAAVAESVEENPGLSIPRRFLELGIPQTLFLRILHTDLNPKDHQQRRVFADWVVEMHENDPEFHQKIILSDEAHFHLGGFVNKQKCRIWDSENPRVIVEKPLYPQRVTVSAVYGPAESLDHSFSKMKLEQQLQIL